MARLDPIHARLNAALAEFAAKLPQGARVLDAGAGECPFRPLFETMQYIAVDSAVGDATWDYTKLALSCDLAVLPFGDGTFDAAVNTVVLEHVKDPAKVLGELRRVLRPGAPLFIALPQIWELHQAV